MNMQHALTASSTCWTERCCRVSSRKQNRWPGRRVMLKHYITQALRGFWRFRVTAGVNLLGLVLAVVCFVASYLYIDSLVRSDMHFAKAPRTYVLTQELWRNGSKLIPAYPSAGAPVAAYLRVDFPGLEAVARALP